MKWKLFWPVYELVNPPLHVYQTQSAQFEADGQKFALVILIGFLRQAEAEAFLAAVLGESE